MTAHASRMTPLLCGLAALQGNAFAQDAGLEEIIVTAERRAQSVQDVPSSVAAFSAESLNRSGIATSVDLQLRTPGMLVSTNGSFGQPYIRGIGSEIINPGTEAPVAMFLDGAYQPRATAAIVDFYDIERVEVLKGPQGTLYGRNATGGAINVVTRNPEDDFGIEADALFGNYDRVRVRAAANAPVGAGGLRLSGMYIDRDGYSENLLTGETLDSEDLWSVRGKLRLPLGDGFEAIATVEHHKEDSTRNNAAKIIDDPDLPLPVRDFAPLLGYVYPGVPADPREVRFDFQPRIFLEQTRANLTLTWSLGFADLQSITGYTALENIGDFDLDGTEINFAYDREADESDAFSQSFLLKSTGDGRLEWLAGLEYLSEDASQNFDARLPLLGPPSDIPLGPDSPLAGFIWDSDVSSEAAAVFVEGKFALFDRVKLIAGVRYTDESKEADFTQTIIDPFGIITGGAVVGTIVIPAQPEESWDAWTPRVGVEFRPVEDTLLYATITRGFKSGGFNLLNNAETFDPEEITSYEAGVKSTWLDDRLRTNLAAFFYDYTDLQVNQFTGVSNFITNAAESEISGAELDLLWQPSGSFAIDLVLAYLDATYEDYFNGQVDLSGNRMPKAPEFTASGGLEYQTTLAGAGSLMLRIEARYQSDTNFDQFETPELVQDSYTLANARLTYESEDARWRVSLYGNNLGDEEYVQSMVRVDTVFGTIATYAAPRTYGVEVGFSY